jgi:hypothetical protein
VTRPLKLGEPGIKLGQPNLVLGNTWLEDDPVEEELTDVVTSDDATLLGAETVTPAKLLDAGLPAPQVHEVAG